MKKRLLAALCLVACTISMALAVTVRGRFVAYDGDEYVGMINLSRGQGSYARGEFWLKTADGTTTRGTYNIETENNSRPEPGLFYTIVFYCEDGNVYRGRYVEPLEDKRAIDLEGFWFQAEY